MIQMTESLFREHFDTRRYLGKHDDLHLGKYDELHYNKIQKRYEFEVFDQLTEEQMNLLIQCDNIDYEIIRFSPPCLRIVFYDYIINNNIYLRDFYLFDKFNHGVEKEREGKSKELINMQKDFPKEIINEIVMLFSPSSLEFRTKYMLLNLQEDYLQPVQVMSFYLQTHRFTKEMISFLHKKEVVISKTEDDSLFIEFYVDKDYSFFLDDKEEIIEEWTK